MRQSAEIRELFEHPDPSEQKQSLRAGVASLLREAVGPAATTAGWESASSPAEAGGRFVVPPAYSDLWLGSLLRAVQKNDPLYDASHERAWRSVLLRRLEARPN